jgi:hypothetical protein
MARMHTAPQSRETHACPSAALRRGVTLGWRASCGSWNPTRAQPRLLHALAPLALAPLSPSRRPGRVGRHVAGTTSVVYFAGHFYDNVEVHRRGSGRHDDAENR